MKSYKLSAMNCHYRFYELEYFFQKACQNGFEAIEIWTSPYHFYLDYRGYDNVQRLSEQASRYGLEIICICPEQTNPKPNNIAIKDKQRRRNVFQYYCNAIDVAAAVCKTGMVLVTPGWSFYNEEVEAAWQRSIEMLQALSVYGETKGVILALEALQYDESRIANSCQDLKLIWEQVAAPNLKICIDFGAMAGAGDNLEDYFKLFGSDIVHCHFVDGCPTGHLAWGDGNRDMAADLEVLSQYGYQGYLSLETAASRYFANPALADRQTVRHYQDMMGGE